MLTVIFLLETLLKLFAKGFICYFTDAWCLLDFVIGLSFHIQNYYPKDML